MSNFQRGNPGGEPSGVPIERPFLDDVRQLRCGNALVSLLQAIELAAVMPADMREDVFGLILATSALLDISVAEARELIEGPSWASASLEEQRQLMLRQLREHHAMVQRQREARTAWRVLHEGFAAWQRQRGCE